MEPNSWPADRVERWPIGRLIPYARNPVLVGEDGGIIAGHCRVLAGRQLGLAEVPVMLAVGWSEAGSGTTIIAAEMTGRACHALEINPAYVDVSIERWQNFSGEKARKNGG